jgi:protease IV
VGFSKVLLSRGAFAEIAAEYRSFTDAEEAHFEEATQHMYRTFRDKAAASRGMEPEEMEVFAQGRIWLGMDAVGKGYDTALHIVVDNITCAVRTRLETGRDTLAAVRS